VHPVSRSVTPRSPLRIAVVVASQQIPRWSEHVLRELEATDGLSVALLLICAQSEQAAPRRPSTLFRLYEAIDHRLCASTTDALATAALPADLAAAKSFVRASGDAEAWKDFVDGVEARELDVVVALCPLNNDLLALAPRARYGIWSVDHGAEADPPGAWLAGEVSTGTMAVETRLEMRTGSVRAASVVACSFQAVDPVSLHRTRSAASWKAAHLLIRSLQRLHGGREPVAQPATGTRSAWHPSNLKSIQLVVKLLFRVGRGRLRARFWWNQWFVAYRRHESPGGFEQATVAASPDRRSLMDPCVVERDGEHVIFVEDFSLERGRAGISYLRIDADGQCSGPFAALERDHHLSYPFVIEWQDELYMIPETASAGAVELYRAERFPDRWQLVTTLMDNVAAVDPTICEHDGRVWLFANKGDLGVSVEDELYLFYSDSLFGPWHGHPLNPIVSDVRRARPAGRLFLRDGHLIRPGQDSSRTYGGAVVFNRVDVLTEEEYRETPVGRIERDWRRGNLGSHCYNADSVYEVVDGRARRLRPIPTPRWARNGIEIRRGSARLRRR
jgi:hypothetical protein